MAATLRISLVALLLAAGCATGRPGTVPRPGETERGVASWYGPGFQGNRTANGEIYDMHGMTAAHRTLPFGAEVEVRNLDNGRSVRVRINDRGPFVRGRIIDLSRGAAEAIGMIGPGTARVEVQVVDGPPRSEWPVSGYLVEAGIFEDRRAARSAARDLSRDYPHLRVRLTDDERRVRVGPLKKRRKAERVVAELEQHGLEAVLTAVR